MQYFADVLPSLMREGGKATWWNGIPSSSNLLWVYQMLLMMFIILTHHKIAILTITNIIYQKSSFK